MNKPSLLFFAAGIFPAAAIPAFPGAEGYGANAVGGRGGDVYHVKNLNASGAGSFVEGISTVPAAGRTIVFDVSGYIRFPSGSNGTRLTSSKVTIAGQTAPGDGVGFHNNFFRISGDDIVVRHLRFRMGKNGSGGDCIDLDSGCLNAMLDHVSMQFSTDENMSSFGSPPENLTLQYSLNAWGLESHSCGGLWDQNHATSHHNLWAHNHTRNPKARPNGLLEWVNNVTYDWDIGFIMGDSQSNQNWKSNVLSNYFIGPPGNTHSKALVEGTVGDNGKPNFTVFLSGNLSDTDGDGLLDGTDKGYSIVEGTGYAPGTSGLTPGAGGYYKAAAAFGGSTVGVATDTPLVAYKKVVSNSGALRMDSNYTGTIRDEVDTILMNKLTTQTRGHVSRESDTGASASGFGVLKSTAAPVDTDQDGMPDFYESALAWNPAVQDHTTALANSGGVITGTTFFPTGTVAGYTRLEEYLQFLAIPHATVPRNVSGTPSSIQMDLRKFTSGFATSPSFSVAAVFNGAVTQYLPDGVTVSATGPIVKFTPTLNYAGRARFDFSVTDAAGSSWTQTFAILVSQSGLPRDLTWKGDGSANVWDSAANNWLRNAAATTFLSGDRVAFDDSGSKTPAVNVTATVAPATVDVDASGNYTFGGTGAITATGTLTKRGTGTLSVKNVQSYTGGGMLEAGTIAIATPGSLSGGTISMLDGTVLTNAYPADNTYTHGAGIGVPAGSTATFNTGNRLVLNGALTGAGTLNCNVQTSVTRADFKGVTGGFAGNLNFKNGGGVRLYFNGGSFNGFGLAAVDVGGSVSLQPQTSSGGNTLSIAALSGSSASANLGGGTAGAVGYSIGGSGTSTSYAGSITGNATLTKTGAGSLTLGGTSTYTGATTVSGGALIVAGSLGNTPTTVSSGAMLAGGGTLAGSVTASAGSFLSPGTAPFTGATMNLNNALALNGATLYFDMSNTPGGANDRIAMGGGALSLIGTQNFQILLLQNTLAAGTYDLITGASTISASGYTLSHNLPTGTRQTFNLAAAGTTVRLTVSGDPATLTWTGTTSANWDTTTANNWTGASPNTFGSNDAVVIDDSSSVTSIAIPTPVTPRSTLVNNSTRAFTIGGGINGGSLTKSGTNSLTLSGANTFGGGLTLNAGTIALSTDTANNSGLGTGPVTMNAGVISMRDDDNSYNAFNANLVVPAGATARLNADSRVDMYGTLSGAGTLNFYVPWIRTELFNNWSAFTGTINVLSDSSGGHFRMGSNYYYPGFPQASVVLNDHVLAYYTGILNGGAGTTIEIGQLAGTTLSALKGGPTGGRALTYRIGGKNTNATFAGSISEQISSTATNYVKTGTGSWTLGGTGSWNGGTTVEQGILNITGSFASAGAVNVASGATFNLTNGALTTDVVNLNAGAFMTAYGTFDSDLNANGTLEGRGFGSGTPGSLTVRGSAFFGSSSLVRLRGGSSSDLVAVAADLSLSGTVQIALAPGTTFGRYPLMTYGGDLDLGTLTLTGISGGPTAQLSATVAGRIDLVIDDSDEDGLPDSWETANFGNLTKGPNDDPDGDGQSNAIEYLAGTLPNNGASLFAARIFRASANTFTLTWPSVPGKIYVIETSPNLAGAWSELISMPAAVSPAESTSYPVAPAGSASFYRVLIRP